MTKTLRHAAARALRRAENRPSGGSPKGKTSAAERECIECEVRDGVPTIRRGKAQAHYHAGQGGQRTLVLQRREGERIQIDGKTEIVILEIGPGEVQISIESVPDDADQ